MLRPPLRLLRFLIVVLSLERGMVGLISHMMLPLLDLQSSQLPKVVLKAPPQSRRCTLRATTMQTSWGVGGRGCTLASLATGCP